MVFSHQVAAFCCQLFFLWTAVTSTDELGIKYPLKMLPMIRRVHIPVWKHSFMKSTKFVYQGKEFFEDVLYQGMPVSEFSAHSQVKAVRSWLVPVLLVFPPDWELLSTLLPWWLLSLTLFLTVADVTPPQRGLEALKQDGVGWDRCVGWSKEAAPRRKDGSRLHLNTFSSKD